MSKWIVLGGNEQNPSHKALFGDFIGTDHLPYADRIKAESNEQVVLHFRNYKNHVVMGGLHLYNVCTSKCKFAIQLPFRQTYFSEIAIPNSTALKKNVGMPLLPHVETWIYETIVYGHNREEMMIKSRYLGESGSAFRYTLTEYQPNGVASKNSRYAPYLCTLDTICENRGFAMDDYQLRMYHALYHNYRAGVEMYNDTCVSRAITELHLTLSFGQCSRSVVPDDYHDLWYALSQAVPLRLWYKDRADPFIRAQCSFTHNHPDYLHMACEFSKMVLDSKYEPKLLQGRVGQRWVKFADLASRNRSSPHKDVKELVELLDTKYMFSLLRDGQIKYKMDTIVRQPVNQSLTHRAYLLWDRKNNIWIRHDEPEEKIVYDIELCYADDGKMCVTGVNNPNLHRLVLEDGDVAVPFFKNKHLKVDDALKHSEYKTDKVYVIKDTPFQEWSLSTHRQMCGRYLIQLIQSVLGTPQNTIEELDLMVSRDITDMGKLKGVFRTEPELFEIIDHGIERLKVHNMLWNMFDLKIAINAVGLELGVVFFNPNTNEKHALSLSGHYSVVNFDKYYRPCYYDRYVFVVIHHNHWYFLTCAGSMFFTKELLFLLPSVLTTYYSYGREAILHQLIVEKGT